MLKEDAVLVRFHSTDTKSLKQQTGPDGVQTTLALTPSQRPRVDGGMLVSSLAVTASPSNAG